MFYNKMVHALLRRRGRSRWLGELAGGNVDELREANRLAQQLLSPREHLEEAGQLGVAVLVLRRENRRVQFACELLALRVVQEAALRPVALGHREGQEGDRLFELLQKLRVLFTARREFLLRKLKSAADVTAADKLDEALLLDVEEEVRRRVEDLGVEIIDELHCLLNLPALDSVADAHARLDG